MMRLRQNVRYASNPQWVIRAVLTAVDKATKYDEAAARLRAFAKTLNEES